MLPFQQLYAITLDDIFSILGNPLFLLIVGLPVFLFVGIVVGTWLSQPRKHRILDISPESGRGIEYEVESEDRVNAYCNAIGTTPPQRFIKRQPAYNILRKGIFKIQNYALWLGRLGTAYTYRIDENQKEVKVTLREAIKNLFGDQLYERIPNDSKTGYIKDKIEKSAIAVTVEFPQVPLSPDGLPSVSSDDIRRTAIDRLINAVVRGVHNLSKHEGTGDAIKIIAFVGCGVAIGIILSLIFHWGSPTIIQNGGSNS